MSDRCDIASRLFIAIPAYTGTIEHDTMHSVLDGMIQLRALGMHVTMGVLEGCCYLCHARNQMVADFLDSDCTDMLFVDADMGFGVDSLARICAATRPLVAGIYRKKCDRMDFNLKLPSKTHNCEEDGTLVVEAAATGFLRINRAVFDAMKPNTMEFGRDSDPKKCDRRWRNYFRTLYEDGLFWGEDFQFCRDALAAGFKTHVIPDLTLRHVGKKVYEGNWAQWMASNGAAKQRVA